MLSQWTNGLEICGCTVDFLRFDVLGSHARPTSALSRSSSSTKLSLEPAQGVLIGGPQSQDVISLL